MKWDFDDLEKKLNNSSKISKEIDEKNTLKYKIKSDKYDYFNVNNAYKKYISQYKFITKHHLDSQKRLFENHRYEIIELTRSPENWD